MASKTKRETSSVKEKKPSFSSQPHPNDTIQRRRSLGPTAIPCSPDRNLKQIQMSLKPSRSLNTDPFIPRNPSKKLHTSTPLTTKPALQRRTSLDKPSSLSQISKQLTSPNSRDKKSPSSVPVKPKSPPTPNNLQRPTTKDTKQNNTFSKVSKPNVTTPRLSSQRSLKASSKEVEKPTNVRKTTSSISPKQKGVTSSYGSTRKPQNTRTTTTSTSASARNDESLVRGDDYNVEIQKESIDVDDSPVEVVILEDKGSSDLLVDDSLLNEQEDDLIYYPHEIEESVEPEFEEIFFSDTSKKLTESEVMHYQQLTNLYEDNDDDCDEDEDEEKVEEEKQRESIGSNEVCKSETDEEKEILVNEGIQVEEENNTKEEEEKEEVKVEKENPIVMSSVPKKDSPAYNDVIKETVNKLVEQRKNRVRALVGAFETVISLEDPMADNSPSPSR